MGFRIDLTTPEPLPNLTKYIISQVSIDSGGHCEIAYVRCDATGAAISSGRTDVVLSTADTTTLIQTIITAAQAAGVLPQGALGVI